MKAFSMNYFYKVKEKAWFFEKLFVYLHSKKIISTSNSARVI